MKRRSRLLFLSGGALWLADSQTGETKEIPVADYSGRTGSLALSPDERTIYFLRDQRGADVYLLTRERVPRQ